MEAVVENLAAVFESAESAVTLAIGLIGALALWLGVIRVVAALAVCYLTF